MLALLARVETGHGAVEPITRVQPCEVWTRVMGYHRPVASFNTGKQGEHAERRFFSEQTRGGSNAC